MNVDLLQDCEGPGIDQSELVNKDVSLISEDLTFEVLYDELNLRVAVDGLVQVCQKLAEYLLENRACALATVEWRHASVKQFLGQDLGVKLTWRLLVHEYLINC